MRIVAGTYRGRQLRSPENDHARPTLDRVREALFSSLFSLRGELDGACVLDAFAGSGALGLEALSRGASRVVFYENDSAAQRVIRANVGALGAGDAVELCCCDVFQKPPDTRAQPFDLVLLDPPYSTDVRKVVTLLEQLHASDMLAPRALISYEHAASQLDVLYELLDETCAVFHIVAEKKYGKTRVTFLQTQL